MDIKMLFFYIFSILLTIGVIAWFVGIVVYFIMYQKRLHSDDDGSTKSKKGWIKTVGTYTGKSRHVNAYSRVEAKSRDYLEYEIKYFAENKAYSGWYSFYPVPDPDFWEEGISVSLQYLEKKPWRFEIIEILE